MANGSTVRRHPKIIGDKEDSSCLGGRAEEDDQREYSEPWPLWRQNTHKDNKVSTYAEFLSSLKTAGYGAKQNKNIDIYSTCCTVYSTVRYYSLSLYLQDAADCATRKTLFVTGILEDIEQAIWSLCWWPSIALTTSWARLLVLSAQDNITKS